jgi:hypothetical protein
MTTCAVVKVDMDMPKIMTVLPRKVIF